MSRSIKSRSAEQCRSHHLKFLSLHHIDLNYESRDYARSARVLIKTRREVEQVQLVRASEVVTYKWHNQNRFCFVVDEKNIPAYTLTIT